MGSSSTGGKGSAFVEKLPVPKFKGEPLQYVEFKKLFVELMGGMNIPEAATLDYLRKSLSEPLVFVIKGARTVKEAWARLDERFADRVGAISSILTNLENADLGRGRLYEKVERLDGEIKQATHLLEELLS